jgi:hypothetical protein
MLLKRNRLYILALLVSGLCLIVYGCVPTPKSLVGTYAPNDDSNPATLVLKGDGTFSQVQSGEEIGSGKWKIASAYHLFKSVELDGTFRLSMQEQGPESQHLGTYSLVHKGGKLCLDVDQVLLVWCKVS